MSSDDANNRRFVDANRRAEIDAKDRIQQISLVAAIVCSFASIAKMPAHMTTHTMSAPEAPTFTSAQSNSSDASMAA